MESLKQLFANFSLSAILPALIIAVGGIVIIRLLLVIVKKAPENKDVKLGVANIFGSKEVKKAKKKK